MVSNQQQGPEEVTLSTSGLRDWLSGASLSDLFSDRGHSVDFDGLRAEYVSLRVRWLAYLFALLAPLWIPLDYFFLDSRLFLSLLSMRAAFSVCYLALAIWSGRPGSMVAARWRVFLFLLIPGLFYVGSRLLMDGSGEQEILVGYFFLPFLLVALLAVFPLTLLEGGAFVLLVGAFVAGFELYAGTLFDLSTLADLWLLGLLAAIALWAELTQLHMLLRLYREATRDPLTRLVNRRVLNRWLTLEVPRAHAERRPLSVLLFDLDLFKRINDTYGHLVGDFVLRAFGELLSKEVATSLVGRYGGEEFLAILPGVDGREALTVAERIRQGCCLLNVATREGKAVSFTTSVGVAQLAAGEDAEALIARVDQGLYRAKEAGRDLVTLAD
jgi:diguanylate cyclase (GGDEF)-like protein